MYKKKITSNDVFCIIKSFLNDSCNEWEWDDFISIPIENSFLEKIRIRCAGLTKEFPPQNKGEYCNDEGVKVLEEYLQILTKK